MAKEVSLERKPEDFFGHLSQLEVTAVKDVVELTSSYLMDLVEPYIITAVGGILRRKTPRLAKDIDLAVVSTAFKSDYSDDERSDAGLADYRRYCSHVETFFETVRDRLTRENGSPKLGYTIKWKGSDVPIGETAPKEEGFEYGSEAQRDGRTEQINLSIRRNLGWWNSKGFRLGLPDCRPVDIQIVYNRTPEEWKEAQQRLSDHPYRLMSPNGKILTTRRGFAKTFPYAILAKN